MKAENEMEIEDLSSIHGREEGDVMEKTNGVEDFILLSGKGSHEEKQSKVKYLKFLQEKNKEMYEQIKILGKQLDSQIQKVRKKGYFNMGKLTNKKRNPHVKVLRPTEVEAAYQEINKLKRQIQGRKLQRQSLSLLEQRFRSLKSEYRIKYQELMMKQRTLHELQKKQKEVKKIQNNLSTEVSQNQIQSYENQTKLIKQKIKEESTRVQREKSQFIKNNRGNRKAKSQKNHSLNEIRVKVSDNEEYLTPKAAQMKREYEKIGKRIQLLRIQKLTLMNSQQGNEEKKKYLNHLKSKLIEVNKILK